MLLMKSHIFFIVIRNIHVSVMLNSMEPRNQDIIMEYFSSRGEGSWILLTWTLFKDMRKAPLYLEIGPYKLGPFEKVFPLNLYEALMPWRSPVLCEKQEYCLVGILDQTSWRCKSAIMGDLTRKRKTIINPYDAQLLYVYLIRHILHMPRYIESK